MKFETYLLLGLLLLGVWKTHRSVRRSTSASERFFAIRASAITWLVGIAILVAFLFLPGRAKVLLLLPAFMIVMTVLKFWQSGRTRLRHEQQDRVDFDRMKRVN